MAREGLLEKPVTLATSAPVDATQPGGQPLGHGRTLVLVPPPDRAGAADMLEVRSQGGTLELRIRITEAGPVLEMEGIRLAVSAADSLELRARRVSVEAEQSLTLASRGEAQLLAHERIQVRTREYLGLDGKLVGLRSDERAIVRELAEREFGGDVARCLQWLAEQAPTVEW